MAYDHIPPLEGEGGKGGGGGQELPNTLRSDGIAKYIDLLSEGPIQGLVTGDARSIFFNKVPVKNADGSLNFDGFGYAINLGTEEQEYLPGFDAVTNEYTGPGKATHAIPALYQTNASQLDRVIVTLQTPALVETNKDTGDTEGSHVHFQIEIMADCNNPASIYVQRVDDILSGKCTSAYERSYNIGLQGAPGPYRIRLIRFDEDATTVATQNEIHLGHVTEILDHKISYADSAVVGATADSQVMGNAIPNRAYEIFGVISEVPSNYDPLTRTYTGYWDGSFKMAYHNNPAWVLWALATNTRYGIGLPKAAVDKFELYQAARYCDDLVPDGFGGQEPRFTFNGVIANREEAYKVLQSVASMMRGILFYASGSVIFRQNKLPDQVWKTFTLANIEGDFNYSSTSLTARHNRAVIKYIDPKNQWGDAYVSYEDKPNIQKFGVNSLDLTAYGTTARGQAYRYGKWAVLTELLETETVQFVTGLDGYDCLPGDIIEIADPQFATADFGGRIVSMSGDGTQVTLDRSIHIKPTDNPYIHLTLISGAPEDPTENIAINRQIVHFTSRVLNTTGDYTVLNLQTPVPAASVTSDIPIVWVLSTDALAPREFRVLTNEEKEKGKYKIAATEFNRSKFGAVDDNFSLDIGGTTWGTLPPTSFCKPPTNLVASDNTFWNNGAITISLNLDWHASGDPWLKTYFVGYQKDNGVFQWADTTGATNWTFNNLPYGHYTFAVYAINRFGTVSATITKNVDLSGATAVGKDLVYELDTDRGDLTFIGRDAKVQWKAKPIVHELGPNSFRASIIPATDGLADPGTITFDTSNLNSPKFTVSGTFQSGDLVQVWVGRAAVTLRVPTGDTNDQIATFFATQFSADADFTGTASLGNVVTIVYTNPIALSPIVDDGTTDPFFKRFVIQIKDSTSHALMRTDYSKVASYVYKYEFNVADVGPTGTPNRMFDVSVAVEDIFGGVSNFDNVTINNPAPDAPPEPNVQFDTDSFLVSWAPCRDPDYAGTQVYMSTTVGFTPDSSTLLYDGPGGQARIPLTIAGDYYVRVGYYDTFAHVAVNFSDEKHVNQDQLLVDQIDQNAETLIRHVISSAEERGYLELQTFLNGTDLKTVAIQEQSQRTTADSAFASSFSLLGAKSPDGTAWIMDLNTVKVSPVESLADRLSALAVTSGNNAAAIVAEQQVRATADTAEANTRVQLAASVAQNTANIITEQSVRASADSAFATNFTLLGAANALATAWVLDGSTVQTSPGTSMSSQFSSINSSLGANAANISTVSTTVNGLTAEFKLTVNSGNHHASITAFAGGSISTLIFSAGMIGFDNGGSGTFPFSIVGGKVIATNFQADDIKANTITANMIIGGEITRITTTGDVGQSTPLAINSPVTVGNTGTFTCFGGQVMVFVDIESAVTGANAGVRMQLIRNGSLNIGSPRSYINQGSFGEGRTYIIFDNPGAGNVSYQANVDTTSGSGSGASVTLSNITCVELRK